MPSKAIRAPPPLIPHFGPISFFGLLHYIYQLWYIGLDSDRSWHSKPIGEIWNSFCLTLWRVLEICITYQWYCHCYWSLLGPGTRAHIHYGWAYGHRGQSISKSKGPRRDQYNWFAFAFVFVYAFDYALGVAAAVAVAFAFAVVFAYLRGVLCTYLPTIRYCVPSIGQ